MSWQEFEPILRERLTRSIESQPEVLLEHDGGPLGLTADVILATLYGVDEEVDAEWRIPRPEPTLYMAIPERVTLAAPSAELTPFRKARYELQSNWATLALDWLLHRDSLPADVKPDPGTFQVTVALLRYRRRL